MILPHGPSMTEGEFLHYKLAASDDKSGASYRPNLENHLLPYFGDRIMCNVCGRDVFDHHFTKCRIQMSRELVFVVLGSQRADGGLFEDIKR